MHFQMNLCLKFSALVFILCFSNSIELQLGSNQPLPRVRRFFNFFNYVRFANDECVSTKAGINGTCYRQDECTKLGGTAAGSCAQNYGVCCVFMYSCLNKTSQESVIFTNPSYPGKDSAKLYCYLAIDVTSKSICQIRLDFDNFEIDQPKLGDCTDDHFIVYGEGTSNLGIGSLCGKNNGQHMYVELSHNLDAQSVTLVFVTNTQGDYQWKIRVNQVNCKDDRKNIKAPSSCLQYYKGMTNTISSFNQGQYIVSQDYAICIEKQPNICSIKYKAAKDDFSIDTDAVEKTKSGVGTTECAKDYLVINQGSATGKEPTQDRFCGSILNPETAKDAPADIISRQKGPLMVRFHTDATHEATVQKGFRITYEQLISGCQNNP